MNEFVSAHYKLRPAKHAPGGITLPDVSSTDAAAMPSALQWVGMQGIDLPVRLQEPDVPGLVHAKADVQVDLPHPEVKGIHMSRLYRLLDQLAEDEPLSPALLHRALAGMIHSQRDGGSTSARVRLEFDLLVRRPALVTEGLSGWKSYPVRLDAVPVGQAFTLGMQVKLGYSSTCPCSAALARQLVAQGFSNTFSDTQSLASEAVAQWLTEHATLATPHSQRSEARVKIDLPPDADELGVIRLIDLVEDALGTPVQTAVKRADEQAFAAHNGQNLMFVEDAARRIQAALKQAGVVNPRAYVRHIESLHPHDAVAWAGEPY